MEEHKLVVASAAAFQISSQKCTASFLELRDEETEMVQG